MSDLKALIINCTLKKSPERSNTQVLADKVIAELESLGARVESIRFVDYMVHRGVSSDEGNGDQWPEILAKIKCCDICIIAAPVWMGRSASTVQQIFERLDDVFYNKELQNPETGQFFPYGKVAGAIVTGSEDGAHEVAAHILWGMQELGFTIPPNANTYWVGLAGSAKDYIKAGGEEHFYTNKTNLYLAHNLVYFARLLKENPIPVNIKELNEKAKNNSKHHSEPE